MTIVAWRTRLTDDRSDIGGIYASPNILLNQTSSGYTVEAVESTSLIAKIGKAGLFLFCLIFLFAGVIVWFLPDNYFDGDPFLLKCIVTGATWVFFGPMFYFTFLNDTSEIVEVDTTLQMVHQIYRNKDGKEKKRRSNAFSEISKIELLDSNPTAVHGTSTRYGQIYMSYASGGGTSLLWGNMDALFPVWTELRKDILGQRD
ncbi:hypothetical protein N9C96_01500 [bacterium]|nr:hypothetical protein [bacterium]